jgi:hypothetical protein
MNVILWNEFDRCDERYSSIMEKLGTKDLNELQNKIEEEVIPF